MAILIAFLGQVKEGEAEITDFCSRLVSVFLCILFLPDRETPIGQKATALRAGPVKVPVVLFLLSKPGR